MQELSDRAARQPLYAEPLIECHLRLFAGALPLAGIVAESKYNPGAIHRYQDGAYDLLVARLLIDAWNERRTWPPISCDGAARRAFAFVEERWTAISNVALALGDTGSLDDHAVRVFAACQ